MLPPMGPDESKKGGNSTIEKKDHPDHLDGGGYENITGDWLDSCIVKIAPLDIQGGTASQIKIDAPCVQDGDMIIFMPIDMPKSVHMEPTRHEGKKPSSDEAKHLMKNKAQREPAAACENAHLVADDPNMGGAVTGGNISVKLSEAVYTMCLARKQDFEATHGGGFWYYYGAEPPHYAVLSVGQGGNLRTRPWEPSVKGGEETFEEDDCTMSNIFCKHNRTAANTTSTVFAGQVETGKPAIDLAASADERSIAAGLLDPANQSSDQQSSSSGGGHWRADGTWWAASAGSAVPPAPPPPPLAPGQSWQDNECDVASWLCPNNRSSTGTQNFGFGPGGISRWKTATSGTPTAVGIAWWWILVIFGILLCCICCVFCFLGCQRRSDPPEVDNVGTTPLSASRWSGGMSAGRAQVGAAAEPPKAFTPTQNSLQN